MGTYVLVNVQNGGERLLGVHTLYTEIAPPRGQGINVAGDYKSASAHI